MHKCTYLVQNILKAINISESKPFLPCPQVINKLMTMKKSKGILKIIIRLLFVEYIRSDYWYANQLGAPTHAIFRRC